VALESYGISSGDFGFNSQIPNSKLSLARVSVVRGEEGPYDGEPFIDHYIHSKEPPADYLTPFSGLLPGDLDPMSCRHWLTTKKAIYQKLRYLVDAGCIFIGHGLATDFKIINMFVPKKQIIDTVELYRLPGKRYIALKFLAAHVLNKNIQSATHDSIEDARTALALYRKYLTLVRDGTLNGFIKGLYDTGYKCNWTIRQDG